MDERELKAIEARAYPQRFKLLRNKDVDIVAHGVLWTDGSVSLRWLGDFPSVAFYADYGQAMRVHHIGEPRSGDLWTTAWWFDGVCFVCGSEVAENAFMGGNGGQCARCSSSWEGPPSCVVEPEKGKWRKTTIPSSGGTEC